MLTVAGHEAEDEVDRLEEMTKLAGGLEDGRVALRDVVARALEKQRGTDRLLLGVFYESRPRHAQPLAMTYGTDLGAPTWVGDAPGKRQGTFRAGPPGGRAAFAKNLATDENVGLPGLTELAAGDEHEEDAVALISQREYGRRRGISGEAVRKRTVPHGGPIPVHGPKKQIDEAEADALWWRGMAPNCAAMSRFQGPDPEAG